MNCTEKIHDENKNMQMNTLAGSCNFYYTCHVLEPKNFQNQIFLTKTHTHTHIYINRAITVLDNLHHSSIRQFHMTRGSAVFAAIPICYKSQSTHFSTAYCSK